MEFCDTLRELNSQENIIKDNSQQGLRAPTLDFVYISGL